MSRGQDDEHLVEEAALRLSCALAFIRWRAAGRTDFLDAAEDLGIDSDGPLALSMWLLFGRTRPGGDLDDVAIRAVLRFCEQILSGAVAASPREAI